MRYCQITPDGLIARDLGGDYLLPGPLAKVRERMPSENNLRQIGLAMHNYHDVSGNFSERVVLDKRGKAGLSWRVKLLPYLDQGNLYKEFHLDEPWDSEHNKKLIELMPPTYAASEDDAQSRQGKTRYLVLVGRGMLFDGKTGPSLRQITDGGSNTIMAVEARPDRGVIWTKPDDLEVDMKEPMKGLKSARADGFQALMADGTVQFIRDTISTETLIALFTCAGGEVVGDF